jgi:hypothetical protein
MDINEQEIWLRVYCAALSGSIVSAYGQDKSVELAKKQADRAVKEFAERFPAFRFHSEENKK